jgi:hypothetical protein
MPTNNDKYMQEIVDFINENFPEWEQQVISDSDVIEILIRNPNSYELRNALMVDYNTWYPGEILIYDIVIRDRK